MSGQLTAFIGIVAGDMRNDGALALHFFHHGFQNGHALFLFQIDALAGGAANIEALDALIDQITGKFLGAFNAYAAVILVAGIKRRDNAAIFFQRHAWSLLSRFGISPSQHPW